MEICVVPVVVVVSLVLVLVVGYKLKDLEVLPQLLQLLILPGKHINTMVQIVQTQLIQLIRRIQLTQPPELENVRVIGQLVPALLEGKITTVLDHTNNGARDTLKQRLVE